MNIGVFKRHEKSYEKRLEIVFYKNTDKAIVKLHLLLCKKGLKIKNCKKFIKGW